MKPIHEWIADMQGSLADPNDFVEQHNRKQQHIHGAGSITKTKWQIRADFADLTTGVPQTEGDVERWLRVFCLSEYNSYNLGLVLGNALRREYARAESEAEVLAFWKRIKSEIDSNVFNPVGALL
jgi:hypothetical protein